MKRQKWFRRILALILLAVLLYLGSFIAQDTHPWLESLGVKLNQSAVGKFMFKLFAKAGFQSSSPVWIASKIYILFNTTLSLLIIHLWFYSRRLFRQILAGFALILIYSILMSILHKQTGHSILQWQAYGILSQFIYPYAPFILIPVGYLLQKLEELDHSKVKEI
jgi:hypothetical protein